MNELEKAVVARERRIKKQMRHFMSVMAALQKEGHDVDEALKIIADGMEGLEIDLAMVAELRRMYGKHKSDVRAIIEETGVGYYDRAKRG